MKKILSIAALAVIASGSAASAATNLVQDGDFAMDTPCCAAYGVSDPYWHNAGTYWGGSLHGVYVGNQDLMGYSTKAASLPNAPGANFQYYYSDGQSNYQTTYIYQTIGGLTAGKTYKLTFKDAFYTEGYGQTGDTEQWAVNWGGGAPTIADPNSPSGGVTKYTSAYTIDGVHGTGWFNEAMTFKATGAAANLAFKSIGTGAPPFALVTDVVLIPIPEPTTWAMMILGVFGVGALARRRRAAARAAAAVAA